MKCPTPCALFLAVAMTAGCAFDPLVQYLAAGGLAVLQVNYRGSAGRGRTFLDAGKRAWGKGIEEDLEAAIEEVSRRGWVDGGRICVAGGSYGGYSALMSVIRHPGRYRCAASINGPTDLPFLYHSSRFLHGTDEGRTYFRDFVGDPEEGYDELLTISPAYRAAEIQVPVLLVHATDDERVESTTSTGCARYSTRSGGRPTSISSRVEATFPRAANGWRSRTACAPS